MNEMRGRVLFSCPGDEFLTGIMKQMMCVFFYEFQIYPYLCHSSDTCHFAGGKDMIYN